LPVAWFQYYNELAVLIRWEFDFQLYVQSVPITTKVVSSKPAYGEMYPIQLYVIKLVSDLSVFFFPFSSTKKKNELHDTTERLLKVAINTVTLQYNKVS